MKYRFSALPLKLLAFLLAAVSLATAFLSGMATLWCIAQEYYMQDAAFQTSWNCRERAENPMTEVMERYRSNPDYENWDRLLENSSLRFILVDELTGDVLASYVEGLQITVPRNLKDNIYLEEENYYFSLGEQGSLFENIYVADYYFTETWQGYSSVGYHLEWTEQVQDFGEGTQIVPVETPTAKVPEEEPACCQLLLLLPKEIVQNGNGDLIYEGSQIFRLFYRYRTTAPVLFGVSVVLLLSCVVFLLLQAGHKPGLEAPRGTWLERIPLELHVIAVIFELAGIFGLAIGWWDTISSYYCVLWEVKLIGGLCAAGAALCGTAVLGGLVSFAARVKLGRWWNGFLCWRVLCWCCRTGRRCLTRLGGILVQGVRSLGMIPRAVLVILAAMLLELLGFAWLVCAGNPEAPLLALILYNLFLLLAIVWAVAQMRILQMSAKALADGDLEHQVDTQRMYWEFEQHADYLNAIAGGMSKAVEKQMKSERLKTELITNVSHDIKTPLTSIVTYVDLLQKPHTEAEEIQYLEVLDRQAKRLKKLTENLVEASKASTGNLDVHLGSTSVTELVNQAVEEYRARLEAGKLETVVDLRGDLHVMADGRLMWRVLDNLLNNVIKYALPGTRVYVTAQQQAQRVVIAVKNISREPLNVDADELMERFVRGDSSRHTEGTGLGLNIARSLTVLQHGTFALTVDGDFFKAEASLPAV